MAELKKEQQSNEAPSGRNQRSRSGLWFGLIVIFIVLGLGGLIFYLDLKHQDQQKELSVTLKSELTKKDQQVMELTEQISGYQTQIAAIQSQLANVQQDSTGKDTHFNKALDDFSKMYSEKLELTKGELKSSIDQVQRLLGKTRSDWLLADAEYLLSIANERLQLVGDVETAKQALESADARLRDSEDAAIIKVREQLGKEIESLAKIKTLDIVGIVSKLKSLQQAADQLTLFLPYTGKKEGKKEQTEAVEKAKQEEGVIDNVLDDIKSYVAIRHSSKPVEGIIGHEEVQFIIQQLKVRLEMAKMALLQQNEALFQSSIEDTKQWLKENFTMDVKANDFLKQLDELQVIKIKSQLPTISESLKLLKGITKLRVDTDKLLPKPSAEPPKAPSSTIEKAPPAVVNGVPSNVTPQNVSPPAAPVGPVAPVGSLAAPATETPVAPVSKQQNAPLPAKP